ncbi:hypothetical protein Y1Q_0022496 [Alligator mississippiensis]|uniref:Uncharacterized protein n=1 Tax=Alligator mississippiensis TaxID=8496 RepID=A0A151N0M5_ALLMI|nr:hypothetical protein Y1Q_0022496 [Alligator mississippiensis]
MSQFPLSGTQEAEILRVLELFQSSGVYFKATRFYCSPRIFQLLLFFEENRNSGSRHPKEKRQKRESKILP